MRIAAPALVCVLAVGSAIFAQEKPASAPPQEKSSTSSSAPREVQRLVPLKVQIVLSRLRAEKKIASLPYTLTVTANERGPSNLRMGIEVPIINRNQGVSYRSVGTNIDCFASTSPGDFYKLNITVEDSSIHLDPAKTGDNATSAGVAQDFPAFRTFKSSFTLLLRDGQSGQYTSAVDPISGEVMKIDVTLGVMK